MGNSKKMVGFTLSWFVRIVLPGFFFLVHDLCFDGKWWLRKSSRIDFLSRARIRRACWGRKVKRACGKCGGPTGTFLIVVSLDWIHQSILERLEHFQLLGIARTSCVSDVRSCHLALRTFQRSKRKKGGPPTLKEFVLRIHRRNKDKIAWVVS